MQTGSAPLHDYEKFDAVILGAGPAGLSAALELSEAGWKVLVIEKSRIPREKVCGGFVGPENQPFLERFGIWQALLGRGALPLHDFVLTSNLGTEVRARMARNNFTQTGLGVERRELDSAMAGAASALGASLFYPAMVQAMTRTPGGLHRLHITASDTGVSRHIETACLIDACGAQGRPRPDSGLSAFGYGALFRGFDMDPHCVALHFAGHGHFGVNPVGNGIVNVCYVADTPLIERFSGNPGKICDFFIRSSRFVASGMQAAERITPWKGVPVPASSRPRFHDGGIFYAGDTAAAVNPVVGGGITLALQGGALLGSLLKQAGRGHAFPEQIAAAYEKEWLRRYGGKMALSRLWGFLSHRPVFTEAVLRVLSLRKNILSRLFEIHHPDRSGYAAAPVLQGGAA